MFINAFVFGFELPIHWTLRLLLIILVVIVMPVLSYLFLLFMFLFGSLVLASEANCGSFWLFIKVSRSGCPFILKLVLYIFALALFMVQFVIHAVLAFALATIVYIICACIFVVSVIVIFFRLLYQWCCKSKRVKLSR